MGSHLIAIVGSGSNGRLYLPADESHNNAKQLDRPDNYPDATLPNNPRDFKTPNYGIVNYSDLFTTRQLTTLVTLSELISEAQNQINIDGGSVDYSKAVAVYLSFVISKQADRGSSICSWDISRDGLRNTFGRQAIPMVWDFAEGNPFSGSSGSYDNMLDWVVKCITYFPSTNVGTAIQHDAQTDNGLRNIIVSTDPPYYDNIGYADLSDFFYIWLRQTLKENFPDIFRTMLVPKTEELVATPYRFDGSKDSLKMVCFKRSNRFIFILAKIFLSQYIMLISKVTMMIIILHPLDGKQCCRLLFKAALPLQERGLSELNYPIG
jgi:putative DNA methylase